MQLSKLLSIKPRFVIVGCLLLSACAQVSPMQAEPMPSPRHELITYQTQTPTMTGTAMLTPGAPEATIIPTATATPFLYSIVANDTLTAIAARYGLKLQELIAANPEIDPNFITVGTTITIPVSENAPAILSNNPTPIPILVSSPACFHTAELGLWCLASITNEQPYDLENISGEFQLKIADEEQIRSQIALLPLNILRSGDSGVLAVYFSPPISKGYTSQISMRSALPVESDSNRYLDSEVALSETQIITSGLQAEIFGEVFNYGDQTGNQIWLAAIAYDKDSKPIGFRKLELSGPLEPAGSLLFSMAVFSLGSEITEIIVLSEIRP